MYFVWFVFFLLYTKDMYFMYPIARNRGHFAPVINCQRNLISKMADKNDRSQGKRIPCGFLNNLSSMDLFYEDKSWNKTRCKKMIGLYSAERLMATKQYADVPFVGMHYMVAQHIVVQHKLNEHCAQRFVSNKHFSKLLLFCTY